MRTLFHARLYGRIVETRRNFRRKKLHRTNKCSNLLGSSFYNRGNLRAPIQFARERQFQHLKRWSLFWSGPVHFHMNSTQVNRLVKLSKFSFFSIEINKPLPDPASSVSYSSLSSAVNSSWCHKSDAWSCME